MNFSLCDTFISGETAFLWLEAICCQQRGLPSSLTVRYGKFNAAKLPENPQNNQSKCNGMDRFHKEIGMVSCSF